MKLFNTIAVMLVAALMVVAGCGKKKAEVPPKDADANAMSPENGGGTIPEGMETPDEPPEGEQGEEGGEEAAAEEGGEEAAAEEGGEEAAAEEGGDEG